MRALEGGRSAEHFQHEIAGTCAGAFLMQVPAVAAPGNVATFADSGSNWVSVYVFDRSLQVGVILHRFTFESLLEQMPNASVARVEMLRVIRAAGAHGGGDAVEIAFEKQMGMVGHEAPAQQLDILLFQCELKHPDEYGAIFVVFEDYPSSHPAMNHMVDIR